MSRLRSTRLIAGPALLPLIACLLILIPNAGSASERSASERSASERSASENSSSELPTYWVPASPGAEWLRSSSDLFYNGLSGRLIGVEPSSASRVEAIGGRRIDRLPGEVLYVFLLENAEKAEFEPTARVLLRQGREVLVATPGDAPVLTPASSEALRGLKQPVLIDFAPRVWPDEEAAPPPQARTADPIIQDMVNAVTQASYGATWQVLDDFENRFYSAAQNSQASQWMLDQFHSYGLAAEFHTYTQSGQRRNVVATLPGIVDPTRVVYITSHFDAISETPSTCAPGADDNGSGTAAVLEAARVLSQYLFSYTIKFACFNGEEQGLVGSAAYVADIAAQGENVIGVFDCDMLAYRGNDPAPPDLVLYTNSASQPLAVTLQNAVQDYIPGQLQPIILVSSLEGSDYASFWAHGYHAICSIEDEAWADDFCPWYHTCNDRIEQYPRDYCVSCTKANLAALATTAVPVNPSGPYLVLGSTVVDDDASGGSSGNGDGRLNPGETIELSAILRNVGNGAATGVHGTLATTSPDVTILAANANWNNIPAGGQGTNLTPFRFQISGTAPDGSSIPFTLTVTDNSGSKQIPLSFPVLAPNLSYFTHRLDDTAPGNATGIIDPGEVIRLPVTLVNLGTQDAAGVQATLVSLDADASVLLNQATVASIPPGGQAELTPGFSVMIAPGAVAGEILDFRLDVTAGAGYQSQSEFRIKVGTAFYDELETNGPWTLSDADDNATIGRWIRVDPNGTVQGGQPVQSEDDHTAAPGTQCVVTGQGAPGGTPGEADLDGGKTTLTSRMVDLSHAPNPRVTYWRWYTNNLGNSPNQDYWVVQVTSNGGTSWVDLERTTSSSNAWQQQSFALNSYITPSAQVKIRFVADDSGANSLVEAAVDDVEFSGDLSPTTGAEIPAPVLAFRLDPARPSPSAGGTLVSFALPAPMSTQLQVFGVDGRLVRTLHEGIMAAGEHVTRWDGRNEAGAEAAPGVYFYRLRSGGMEATRKLVLAR